MSRPQVISKEEIREYLMDGEWHTKAEIANHFNVCSATIAARMFDLAKDGVSSIIGLAGYRIIEPEDITDEDTALAVERMIGYMIGTVTRQAMSSKPMKRLMAEARKLLPKTSEERMIVRKYLIQLTHLIDWQETEEE